MRLLLGLLLLNVALAPLRAQSNWTAVPSPTTHSLWGVAHGGGQFVAVGDHGTIVTSPDGATWTARASGTDVWLTAVTYGLGQFVAVGDRGTVLLSRDGVTWTKFVPTYGELPAERLNVVQLTGTQFTIYGEDSRVVFLRPPLGATSALIASPTPRTWWRGFAFAQERHVIGGALGLAVGDAQIVQPASIVVPGGTRNVTGILFHRDAFFAVAAAGTILTSPDALAWTPQASPTTRDLHAIAAFNNTLVTVGDGGTILSQDANDVWTQRASPTARLLLGVAASDAVAVIVGADGTILRATAEPQAPVIVAAPASLTEAIGGAASFVVRASGSPPLRYQWTRNGQPIAGATRPELALAPLTASDAGIYAVTVTNQAGAATSTPVALGLLPAPAPIVDPGFVPDAALEGIPRGLLPLEDGSVLVPNGRPNELVRLRADGTIDTGWPARVFGAQAAATFQRLILQPDGRILVVAIVGTGPTARTELVRLNRDGSRDPSFAAASEATAQGIQSIDLHADGRIVLANQGPTPLRLLANGALDPEFRPAPLPPVTLPLGLVRERTVHSIAAAADGKLYAAFMANLRITNAQGRYLGFKLVRFNADGTLDPAFSPPEWTGDIGGLRALEDGTLLALQNFAGTFNYSPADARVSRYRADGTLDPRHAAPTIPFPLAQHIYPDGRLLYLGRGTHRPVRLTALGTVDPTFTGGIGQPVLLAPTADGRVLVAGDFELYDGVPRRRLARLNAIPNPATNPPRVLRVVADKTVVRPRETITVRASVTGTGPLTYDWLPRANANVSEGVRTNSPEFSFAFDQRWAGTALHLIVRNARGEAAAAPISFTVLPDPPRIVSQPARIATQSGRDVLLRVQKNDTSGETEIEWRRNGVPVAVDRAWDGGQSLLLSGVTAASAGSYTVTFRNALGETVTSAPIVLTVDATSRFTNLSTRALVGSGAQTLIAGFSIAGTRPRTVIVRGIGPSLARFGVANALPDPQLELLNAAGQRARFDYMSDDWQGNALAPAFEKLGAFPLDEGTKDAAIYASLEPGNYTVHLTPKPGESGVALIEVYEFDNEAETILNLSTRALVRPDTPAISGFAVRGPASKRVLLRATGPALAAFGVTGTLANPRVTLRDAAGTLVAANDDWETAGGASAAELRATMSATGAFPLGAGSRDAALLVTLAPGNYTMVVEGAANDSGVALLEVYEVN